MGTTRTMKAKPQSQPQSPTRGKRKTPESVQLIACAVGIYACYLNYGLLQERIYSGEYGVTKERYTYSTFLLCVQTFVNALGAFIALKVTGVSAAVPSVSALREYALVALAYLSAMWFSFTALGHMTYPMQALGKSCKMVPVMLLGVVIRGRKYSVREYMCVLLITAGVGMFSYRPEKAAASEAPTSALGVGLLLASLFCDGLTGPLQERLVARLSPGTHQLMLWQNVCACAWLTGALGLSGEGTRALSFVVRHPAVLRHIMMFSFVSALGQNFIFYTVRHFSALAVTTITTTRKMFTILLSIAYFKHKIAPRQWAGLALVFAAIGWEAIAKARRKATTKSTTREKAKAAFKRAEALKKGQ